MSQFCLSRGQLCTRKTLVGTSTSPASSFRSTHQHHRFMRGAQRWSEWNQPNCWSRSHLLTTSSIALPSASLCLQRSERSLKTTRLIHEGRPFIFCSLLFDSHFNCRRIHRHSHCKNQIPGDSLIIEPLKQGISWEYRLDSAFDSKEMQLITPKRPIDSFDIGHPLFTLRLPPDKNGKRVQGLSLLICD